MVQGSLDQLTSQLFRLVLSCSDLDDHFEYKVNRVKPLGIVRKSLTKIKRVVQGVVLRLGFSFG